MPNYDFMLETRLKKLNSELAYRHTCCMGLFEMMLKKFLAVFPTFTDHTLLHTLSVTNITNQLLREDAEKLRADEIYIYLMASALHDIGMGVSDKDIEQFIDKIGIRDYVNSCPEVSKPALIRKFHNEFSSAFVMKYWELLEIPNEKYAHAIAQVSRGHRKVDLTDEGEYPTDYDVGNGNKANLAVLAALIRIADELDIASDRNPDLLYDTAEMDGMSEKDVFEFSKHESIHPIEFLDDAVLISADAESKEIQDGVIECVKTIRETMSYYTAVMERRGEVRIQCQQIKLILNHQTVEV